MKLFSQKIFYLGIVSAGIWLSYSLNATSSLASLPSPQPYVRADEVYTMPTSDPNRIILPTITEKPTPTPRPRPTKIPEPTTPWGIAQKIGPETYTINIQYDSAMASPQDVFQALNAYRGQHGSAALIWDDTLANYAASRAELFKNIQGTDSHAGFNDYLDNHDGFKALGFSALGENSYYGGPVTGTHVIEWAFSQSPGHNANQLDTKWTHVGVGVSASGIDLIFAANRM